METIRAHQPKLQYFKTKISDNKNDAIHQKSKIMPWAAQ